MSFVYHSYAIRISSVCDSYVLVCHSYVTRMYSYVIRMSLVCIRISSVCHTYVLVCHSYVTRMYSYVIRMSLLCGFTMNRLNKHLTHKLNSGNYGVYWCHYDH